MASLESITPKVRKQLHQSGTAMLGKCGIQFEFRYLKGLRRRPGSYLLCGTATDAAVSTDLNHKIQTGELENEGTILDVARDSVENNPDRDNLQLDEEEQGMSLQQVLDGTKDKAVRLVTAHHGQVAPNLHPTHVSRKFSLNLDSWLRGKAKELHSKAEDADNSWLKRTLHRQAAHLNVAAREGYDFVGEQDIVERTTGDTDILIIRDTKTSKKSPAKGVADESTQLSAYALASKVLDGKLPDAVVLDYLIDLKRETKVDSLSSKRDEEQVNAYLNRLVASVVAIQSGVFVPAPDTAWWCDARYCGYHSICPHVKKSVTTVGNSLVHIKVAEDAAEVAE